MSMKVKCHAVELSNLSTFGKKEDHLDLYQDPVWSFQNQSEQLRLLCLSYWWGERGFFLCCPFISSIKINTTAAATTTTVAVTES